MSTAPEPVWTLRTLREWTENFLKQKGVESASLEAQILLAHALGCRRLDLFTRSDEVADEAARAKFRELVKQRVAGTPVAYLVGVKEFFKLELEVTPAVLIPRPETEYLIVEALKRLPKDSTAAALDLGTGSGCLALTIAQQRPQVRVTATDISAAALEVARRNAVKHKLDERVRFLEGDLDAPVPASERFALIVSNPPYIATAVIDTLDPGVKNFEPRLALDGGPDGLAVLRRLVALASERLEPGGHLLVEIGYDQEAAARELFLQAGGFELAVTVKDGSGQPRVLAARWPGPFG